MLTRLLDGVTVPKVLRISWTSLFKKPIVLELDGLRVLTTALDSDAEDSPIDVAWFAAQVKARIVDNLTAALQQYQLPPSQTKSGGGSSGGGAQGADSLKERMVARLVSNIVVKVSNVHIRFEHATDAASVVALDFRVRAITMQAATGAGGPGARGNAAGADAGSLLGSSFNSTEARADDTPGAVKEDTEDGANDGADEGKEEREGTAPHSRTKTDKTVDVVDYCTVRLFTEICTRGCHWFTRLLLKRPCV
jgi:hypothetical protein